MAEQQAAHRQQLEKVVVEGGNVTAFWGQHYALTIALAGFVLAGFFGWLHLPWLAGTTMFADIGALAGLFLYGKESTKRERQERFQQFEPPDAEAGEPPSALSEPGQS